MKCASLMLRCCQLKEEEKSVMCSDKQLTRDFVSKVPAVTLMFWAIKICATTVGETGGDAFSMSFGLGYAVSSLIFLAVFFVVLTGQVRSSHNHPLLYWAVVIATTTVGTTMSDYL